MNAATHVATPDLKLLRVFAAVVRHQGFANAQAELKLSVPAISTYMSQLEAQLGVVLCHRGRGGFSLTSRGESFHQQVCHVLRELENFQRHAAGLKGELRGTFRLGVLDAMVGHPVFALTDVIGQFSQRYPAVHLELAVMTPYELQLAVLNDRLDLAVGAAPMRMNGLHYHLLYREQHWLYCASLHPLFATRRVSAEHLAQQRMVSRGYWNQAELARHGFRQSAATVDEMEAQLILILSGAYIGYLPEHYARPWVERGQLRALCKTAFGYRSPFFLILRKSRIREPLILAFREVVQAANHAVQRPTNAAG